MKKGQEEGRPKVILGNRFIWENEKEKGRDLALGGDKIIRAIWVPKVGLWNIRHY